jgi:hypothetical protein
MNRKLDFTLSSSFQNLSLLIEEMKKNGMRFILSLVGIETDLKPFPVLLMVQKQYHWEKLDEEYKNLYLHIQQLLVNP